MFDKKRFRFQLILCGKTIKETADALSINEATLYRKINGESDFYRNEIQILCEFLSIENPNEIFFASKIA